MKSFKTENILPLVVLVIAGLWWATRSAKVEEAAVVEVPVPEGQSLAVVEQGEEVFRRAFWRHPDEDDRILNAERREWSDEEGVDRWQWFLEVRPSEMLENDLFEENRFELARVSTWRTDSPVSPVWFPKASESFEIMKSRDGAMVLLRDQESGSVFATGHGRGFSRAVVVPMSPPQELGAAVNGRIPSHSPPHPGAR